MLVISSLISGWRVTDSITCRKIIPRPTPAPIAPSPPPIPMASDRRPAWPAFAERRRGRGSEVDDVCEHGGVPCQKNRAEVETSAGARPVTRAGLVRTGALRLTTMHCGSSAHAVSELGFLRADGDRGG